MLAAVRALVEQQSVEEDYSKLKYVLNERFPLLSLIICQGQKSVLGSTAFRQLLMKTHKL